MKGFPLLIAAICAGSLLSCNKATPREAFGTAVLNSNLMHGFAGPAMQRELEQPSVKMAGDDPAQTVPMTRAEVIDGKIQAVEASLAKLRGLKVDEDAKPMVAASAALHEFVLSVYRDDYRKLAELHDRGAGAEEIRAMEQGIGQRHRARFEELSAAVTAVGKPYAEKHGIQVQWDVRTSPGG
jgi:hypothetical protein